MTEPYYKTHEPPHCPTCGCGMPRDDAAAALGLLARMRFACGDNGLRMQDELEDYLRGLKRDAERLEWLATNMRRVYGRREVGGYELPDFPIVESGRDACDPQHLRAAIDAAMNGANDQVQP